MDTLCLPRIPAANRPVSFALSFTIVLLLQPRRLLLCNTRARVFFRSARIATTRKPWYRSMQMSSWWNIFGKRVSSFTTESARYNFYRFFFWTTPLYEKPISILRIGIYTMYIYIYIYMYIIPYRRDCIYDETIQVARASNAWGRLRHSFD